MEIWKHEGCEMLRVGGGRGGGWHLRLNNCLSWEAATYHIPHTTYRIFQNIHYSLVIYSCKKSSLYEHNYKFTRSNKENYNNNNNNNNNKTIIGSSAWSTCTGLCVDVGRNKRGRKSARKCICTSCINAYNICIFRKFNQMLFLWLAILNSQALNACLRFLAINGGGGVFLC